MAKGKKTGGRTKGTPNRVTLAKEAEIAKSGLTPLDYMLGLLRDPTQSQEVRFSAAKEAAPFVHPKLASIDGNLNHTHSTHDDALSEIEQVIAAAESAHGLPN